MRWACFEIVLLLLSTNVLGQQGYNYPSPQTPFNGGQTSPQQGQGGLPTAEGYPGSTPSSTSPGGFPRPGPPTTQFPSGGGPSPTNGYPKPSGGYPQGPTGGGSNGGQARGYPTGGYPAAGRPSGPPFPQLPGASQAGPFPRPSSATRPSQGPGAAFPTTGQYPSPTGNGQSYPSGQTPQGPAPSPSSPTGPTGYPSPSRPSGPSFPPLQEPYPSSGQFPTSPGSTTGYSTSLAPGPTPSSPGAQRPQSGYPKPGGQQGGQQGLQEGYPGTGGQQGGTITGQQGPQQALPGQGQEGYGGTQGQQGPGGAQGGKVEGGGEGSFEPSQADEGDYSAIPGQPDIDYPILSYVPETSFKCDQQEYPGYYADVETRCQVFHICANNKTYDFLCPNGTVFDQEHLVCVWWNQFDCNSAPSLYSVNANIYDYSITGAQQQTGAIPASPGGGFPGSQGQGYTSGGRPQGPNGPEGPPRPGEEQPGAEAGLSGGEYPAQGPGELPANGVSGGYQPSGPGAQPQRPATPSRGYQPSAPRGTTQPQLESAAGYPSGASSANGGYPSGGPTRPEGPGQKPSISPQAPSYQPSQQGYPSGGQGPLQGAGGFPGTLTQRPGYLPPRPQAEGEQQLSSSYPGNGQQSNGGPQKPSTRPTGGYPGVQKPSSSYPGSQQIGDTAQQPLGGFPSNQRPGGQQPSSGGYPNGKQPSGGYPAGQQANGGYPSGPSGGQKPQQPTREYLPPV